MEFRDIIKNRRATLSLTLEDIARYVGVSSATVSRWENGDIENVRRDKIAKLAEVLEVSPAYLMGWEDDPMDPVPPEESTRGKTQEQRELMGKKGAAHRIGGRREGRGLHCAVCGAEHGEGMSLCRKCGFPLTDRRGLSERVNLYRRVQALELQNQKLFAALAKHIRDTEEPNINQRGV